MNLINKLTEALDNTLARFAMLALVLGWVPCTMLGLAYKALTKS